MQFYCAIQYVEQCVLFESLWNAIDMCENTSFCYVHLGFISPVEFIEMEMFVVTQIREKIILIKKF